MLPTAIPKVTVDQSFSSSTFGATLTTGTQHSSMT